MGQTSLKKNYIYNVLYEVLILIIPFFLSPYLTRTVGAGGLGSYSFAQSVAQYFVLFIMLGLKNYGNREIARVKNDKDRLSRTFSEIYSMQFLMMLIFFFIYILVIFFFLREDYLIYLVLSLYVLSAGFDINWCCFGLEKFKLTVGRNAIIKVLSAGLTIFFVKEHDDIWKYAFIMAATTLLSQIIIWPYILKEVKFSVPKLSQMLARVKPNFMLFLPVLVISLYTIMDKLILGVMVSKTEVAYFAYSERIVQIPIALITALGTVLLPRASSMLSLGKVKENNILLEKSMQLSMFISVGCMFGLMATAEKLIPLYYGSEFIQCGLYTMWLSPIIVFFSWNTVIRTQYIIPMGLDKVYLLIVAVGACVNLLMNITLIPIMRGTGAVVSTVVAQLMICILQYLFVKKKLPLQNIFKYFLIYIVSGAIMYFFLFILPTINECEIVDVISKVCIGILIYTFIIMSSFYLLKYDMWLFNSFLKIIKTR